MFLLPISLLNKIKGASKLSIFKSSSILNACVILVKHVKFYFSALINPYSWAPIYLREYVMVYFSFRLKIKLLIHLFIVGIFIFYIDSYFTFHAIIYTYRDTNTQLLESYIIIEMSLCHLLVDIGSYLL